MLVTAFYHCWLDGQWQGPHREYMEALYAARFPHKRVHVVWSHAMSEAHTINGLREFAQSDNGVVLYAHTKGAYHVDPFRDRWRESMTKRVVSGWRKNLRLLESGDIDAVGCHWLTQAEYPDMLGPTVPAEGSGFFAGNFWMATCAYLRTLPECEPEPRWAAEAWIGLGKPRVVDLLPGWPHDNRWTEVVV